MGEVWIFYGTIHNLSKSIKTWCLCMGEGGGGYFLVMGYWGCVAGWGTIFMT